MIYVGQILVIPGRGEFPEASIQKDQKTQAGAIATPIDLEVEYTIGPAKASPPPPPQYTAARNPGSFGAPLDLTTDYSPRSALRYGPVVTPNYTMTAELSGKIVLQNMNPDRHRCNFALAVSGDETILRQRLKKQYDRAFLELTADMAMSFDPATGVATVKPCIAAKAGLGSYTFKVQTDSPTHFTSTMELQPIQGSFELAGRKFNFSSRLNIKVDITLHPMPKGKMLDELDARRLPTNQQIPVPNTQNGGHDETRNAKKVGLVSAIAVLVVLLLTRGASSMARIGESINPRGIQNCPAMRSPLWMTIDPNQPEPTA